MGQIKIQSDQAFRDYVVDGLSSSGPNQPSKSQIRTLFALIDSLALRARTEVDDTNYGVQNTDRYVAVAAITAARTLTLPAANTLDAGQSIYIVDEVGGLDDTKTLTIARGAADTIDGANSVVLSSPYAAVRLTSNGATKWKLESAYDKTTVKTNVAQTFTRPQKTAPNVLASGTAWDAGKIQHATVNVNGSLFTIANPTGLIDATFYAVHVTYTTSHGIAWGSNFKGVASITPSGAAGKKDIFFFRANGTILECVGYRLDIGA